MKCENCQKREANINLTQNRDGIVTEHHFCDLCARQLGIGLNLNSFFSGFGKVVGSGTFPGGIFDTAGGIPAFGKAIEKNSTCPSCGQTFDDFRRSGLFGCCHCYEAFADRLDPLLRRVQGSTRHVGRKVCQSAQQQEQTLLRTKLTELKNSLHQAVEAEAYEKAARLRDEIHSLESRLCEETQQEKEGGSAR